MKLTTILSVVATAVATVVADDNDNNNNNHANTISMIQGLPLNYTLAPGAVELLHSHGLWAPDLAAFAAGVPNVDGVNLTAEVERFSESGLDANEVVAVSIDNDAAVGHGGEYDNKDQDCGQCAGCQGGCIVLILFLPFYGA